MHDDICHDITKHVTSTLTGSVNDNCLSSVYLLCRANRCRVKEEKGVLSQFGNTSNCTRKEKKRKTGAPEIKKYQVRNNYAKWGFQEHQKQHIFEK